MRFRFPALDRKWFAIGRSFGALRHSSLWRVGIVMGLSTGFVSLVVKLGLRVMTVLPSMSTLVRRRAFEDFRNFVGAALVNGHTNTSQRTLFNVNRGGSLVTAVDVIVGDRDFTPLLHFTQTVVIPPVKLLVVLGDNWMPIALWVHPFSGPSCVSPNPEETKETEMYYQRRTHAYRDERRISEGSIIPGDNINANG